jgi:hypothetical protein
MEEEKEKTNEIRCAETAAASLWPNAAEFSS